MLELTGGTGADEAFECAGVNAVLDTMRDAVRPGGVVMVQEGKVELKPFITGRIALEDLLEQGFDTLINHKDMAVKVLVRP
ncbi:hypothetical protein [Arthrobacter globiformis]|uniref:hypothetical protein n=1 Tax=Arthrobacter globiformis TaxID=1665 RepID=UPI00278626B6|nr:threonine dehydrogenase-like Zn-dependent dehydrogenase [Arthrobacter globiformis]